MADRWSDWPELLAQFLVERTPMPFVWGVNDCATFAADWVRLTTGAELLDVRHDSALSAMRAMQEEGGLAAAVTARLGEPYEHPQMAGRGDIAIAEMDGEECLVVVDGLHIAGPGEHGLVLNDRSMIKTAWRV